jgi:hypothetical protein
MRCLRSPALKYFPSIVVSPALRPFNAVTTERGVLHDLFQALSRRGISNGCAWTPPSSARPSARQRRAQAKGGPDAHGLGRSKGGLGTKLHDTTDSLGNPASLLASPGQGARFFLVLR